MARAARQKHSKRGERRTDARGKRVARPGAKPARGATARRRSLAKRLAKAKRALKKAVAKRVVKRRVKALQRKVTKRVSSVRARVKSAKKRVTRAARVVGKRLRAAGTTARKRVTRAAKVARKRVTRTVTAATKALGKRPAVRRAVLKRTEPVPPAFATQRASASLREQLMFELQRARASVKAATQGLPGSTAELPVAPGKWSIKEIVLHLSERDRVRLEEISRTLGGQPRSWAGLSPAEEAALNEAHLAPLRAHSWDDALRRLDTLREQLLLRLSEVPSHPDDVWRRGHPFADMLWILPEHDMHHARQIKLARIGATVPVED